VRLSASGMWMRIAAIGGAAVLAATTAGLAAAQAGAATPGGVIHIYGIGGNSPTDQDVVTGAITDYGVDHTGALDHGNVNKIVLQKGTFEANVSGLYAKVAPISSNPVTCSLVIKGTAPVPLSHGTGAYKGIHGSVTVTLLDALIFGKKNGKCNEGMTVTPLDSVGEITGSGHVSF